MCADSFSPKRAPWVWPAGRWESRLAGPLDASSISEPTFICSASIFRRRRSGLCRFGLFLAPSLFPSSSVYCPVSIRRSEPPGSIPFRRYATSRLVRMRRWLPSLPLVFVAFLFSHAHAQGRIDCNVIESRILSQTVHYCVMLPPGYDAAIAGSTPRRYPVLYYLHGLGDNEQTLFKSGGWNVIEDLRQQGQIGSFLVVAPEGRRSFYINSADGRLRYSDFF